MLKVKLGELRGTVEVLNTIAAKELTARASWKVGKVLNAINKELEELENVRRTLVRKYADESGEKVAEDKRQDFFKEYDELLAEEVDLGVEPLLIEDLGDTKIKPGELMAVSYLFNEGE